MMLPTIKQLSKMANQINSPLNTLFRCGCPLLEDKVDCIKQTFIIKCHKKSCRKLKVYRRSITLLLHFNRGFRPYATCNINIGANFIPLEIVIYLASHLYLYYTARCTQESLRYMYSF